MKSVYLDNNATTMVDETIYDKMSPFFVKEFGNPNSLHLYGTSIHKEMNEALDMLYDGLNAGDNDDVIINGCATEGNNTIIKGILCEYVDNPQNIHIITSQIEHPSIRETCGFLEKYGVSVDYLPVNDDGIITPDVLEAAIIEGKTKLISIMWANNETGIIQPIEELANVAKRHGVLFHTDAVQAAGKIKIDLQKVNADYLTMSAHKFHGPKGVGVLYKRSGALFTPLLHGGEQMAHMRAGTVNVPGLIGVGNAFKLANDKLDYYNTEVRALRNRLEDALLSIPDVEVIGKRELRTANTILAAIKGIEGESFIWDMNSHKIAVSTGSACSSESLEINPTFKAMKVNEDLAHTGVRFSLSRFTTIEEIDYTVEKVKMTIERLRSISTVY